MRAVIGRTVRTVVLLLLVKPSTAVAQAAAAAPADPVAESVRELWGPIRRFVAQAAAQAPDSVYAYRPAAAVRSFAQLVGHVTNTHYNFCSAALGERRPGTTNYETLTTKAELMAALDASLDYCDRAYAALTAENATTSMPMFGTQRPRIYPLMFNIAHDNEHYGNMVTYLRLNGMVPPSSQRAAR